MDCKRLAEVVKHFVDIDFLAAEIKACDQEIKTIEELVEYLESELSYAN